jgi:hypothetical protein
MALSTDRGLPAGGYLGAVGSEVGFLRDADVTTGNLEGTLATSGPSKCGGIGGGTCFAFRAPPSLAGGLGAAGFDLVNQANNHSLDFGYAGRAQTMAALGAAGIAETGYPGQITVLRVHGMRVAFLGFAPYDNTCSLLDLPGAQALVREARRRARLVVVFIHAGAEGADRLHTPFGEEYFAGEDRGNPRAFAHAVIRAGASIVLGSGPHVIRGIERYRGHLIAYSLGNFIGYHTLGTGGLLSLSGILRVTLDSRGVVVGGRWFSVRVDGGLPTPDPANAAARLVASLSAQDFPGAHYDIDSRGVFGFPAAVPLRGSSGV